MKPSRAIGLLCLLPFFAGCGVMTVDLGFTCDKPELDHIGPDGKPDPCHLEDVPGVCPSTGICEPVADYWHGPWLLWTGPLGTDPPPCPHDAPVGHEGYADFNPSTGCPLCTCGPSQGSCELPSSFTASSLPCGKQGGTATSFDAPSPWDGSCDGAVSVPAGTAMSVSVAPIAMKETGCTPNPVGPWRENDTTWGSYARVCHGKGWSLCNDGSSFCVPREDHQIPGFHLCISHEGDTTCDKPGMPPFIEKHVIYDGADDTRDCSPCKCGPPVGGECTASLTLDEDPVCTSTVKKGIPIDSSQSACVDFGNSMPMLAGKSSTPAIYHPGTCEPMGGTTTGSLTPYGPLTYCCIP